MALSPMPGRCVIAGGGRWARVVLRELLGILPARTAIVVVSPSAADVMAEHLAKDEGFRAHAQRIEIRRDPPPGSAGEGDIAVVVNKPAQHRQAAGALLERGYHVLVEKPFTTDPAHARELLALAQKRERVVAAGLVFLAAGFVHEFRRRLPFGPPTARGIELHWCDPPAEIRYGEIKRMPADMNLALEVLPHVWSLLKAVFGRDAAVEFDAAGATQGENAMAVAGRSDGIGAAIRFDSAAAARKRLLILKHPQGDAALDFAGDPAVATFGNAAPVELPVAGKEGRPMGRMLRGFVDFVQTRDPEAAWERGIVLGPAIAGQMEQVCAVARALNRSG